MRRDRSGGLAVDGTEVRGKVAVEASGVRHPDLANAVRGQSRPVLVILEGGAPDEVHGSEAPDAVARAGAQTVIPRIFLLVCTHV